MNAQLFFFMLIIIVTACQKETSTEIKYFPKVKAIVTNNCIKCHDSSEPLLWQGRPIDLNGDANIAALYKQIKAAVADPTTPMNIRMPVKNTLPQQHIDTIIAWYNKGGKVTD